MPAGQASGPGPGKTPATGRVTPGPTEDQLQAAFLAARAYGKILDDDVLRAIILAAQAA